MESRTGWSRRNFLGGAGALIGFGLTGCGSGLDSPTIPPGFVTSSSPNPGTTTAGSSPPVVTGNLTGRVNLAEVGGTGLAVVSPYADPAALDVSGAFSTTVSNEGTQLLFLLDNQKQLRAMGLSTPQADSKQERARFSLGELGAASTATSLVFLTRGILTTNPSEAISRVEQVEALPSYSALLAAVRGALTVSALHQILADAEIKRLLGACAREFSDRHLVLARVIEAVAPNPQSTGNIGLSYADADPSPVTQLNFSNSSFRYASLFREDLDAAGNPVPPPEIPVIEGVANPSPNRNIMPAANALSWGSLFTRQAFTPAGGFERIALDDRPQVKKIRYYVEGPGNRLLNNATFPDTLDASLITSDPYKATFIYFAFLPILDLVAGSVRGLEKGAELTLEIASAVKDTGFNADGIRQNYESGDPGNISAAVYDFAAGIFTVALALIATFASGILATVAGVLGIIVGGIAIFFSATNFLIAVLSTLVTPQRASVTIDAPTQSESYELISLQQPKAAQGRARISNAGLIAFSGYFPSATSDRQEPRTLLGTAADGLTRTLDGVLLRNMSEDGSFVVQNAVDPQDNRLYAEGGAQGVSIPVPPGYSIPGSPGLFALNNQGLVAFIVRLSSDRFPEFNFDVALYDNATGFTRLLGVPGLLGQGDGFVIFTIDMNDEGTIAANFKPAFAQGDVNPPGVLLYHPSRIGGSGQTVPAFAEIVYQADYTPDSGINPLLGEVQLNNSGVIAFRNDSEQHRGTIARRTPAGELSFLPIDAQNSGLAPTIDRAISMNNAGDVAYGFSPDFSPDTPDVARLWKFDGSDIATTEDFYPAAINDSGDVVGLRQDLTPGIAYRDELYLQRRRT